ncbi:hypothetical protein CXP39_02865 [Mesoplasma syrphidae]|uniref:ABC-2 type transporter domain-containing protein n=1 Tax=Mesoplasma syrphidae TaxID=225999 RepID=A0A2K9BKG4_9MOLU|nr:hypothetical protein [Mesoplasma syrphidae]AUF83726.1 hypothetical protein CXP39_02865 [Mesoplasma syrphidae]
MNKYNFKREWRVFWLFQKIQTKNWLKNYMNIFLGFFICLYTILCWVAFKDGDPFLMISGICVVIIRNSLWCFLKTLNEWREKGVWEKFSLSRVSTITKHSALIFFNIFSTLIISLVIFLITISCFPKQINYLNNINVGMLFLGILFCWITSYVVALAIHQTFKSYKVANMASLLLYFTSLQFLGLGFPFETITAVRWLNYALYLHPFRYTVNIMQAGFVNAPNMIYSYIGSQGTIVTVDFGYQEIWWLPYLLSSGVVMFYSLIYFSKSKTLKKMTNRYVGIRLVTQIDSKEYIKSLKLAQTLEELKELRRHRKSKE